MQQSLLDDLREKISQHGLQDYEAALFAKAQVAVDLELGEKGQGTVGESRIGGVPDVPPNFEWPANEEDKKFAFLLQINLADVPDFEENPLLRRGLLSFFIGLDEPATDIEHRIFLFDDTQLQFAIVPDEDEFVDEAYLNLPPHRLKFSLRADVPHWATDEWDDLTEGMDDDAKDAYDELSAGSSHVVGQFLGYVSSIGQDTRGDAYIVREINAAWLYNYEKRREIDFSPQQNWRNLLRLDSIRELQMTIWDAGYFNFLIHQDDLRKLDFSRVYMAVETS